MILKIGLLDIFALKTCILVFYRYVNNWHSAEQVRICNVSWF